MGLDDTLLTPTTTNELTHALTWVDPRSLLHPERLDVAVKSLYAKTILGCPSEHSGIDDEACYLKHILYRTGGKEPGDEQRKGSLESFKEQFISLIHSMRVNGFNPEFAIPVSACTGLILNGAHRLAAALSLGIERVPVIYINDLDGLTWNFRWFIREGFTPSEVDEFTRQWVSLQGDRAGCIILWPTLEAHWKEIENHIENVTPIAYRRTIDLPSTSFAELIRDIYATDWGPIPGDNIERKVKLLATHPSRLRFLVVTQNKDKPLSELKNEIRLQWNHVAPADHFTTVHTTDTPRETAYIADLLLNRSNLMALKSRPKNGLRPKFLQWLANYHNKLIENHIDPECCCIVGSSVLEAFGVRNATDIDFTLTHQLREVLFTPGVTHLTDTLDVVAKDYPRATINEPFAHTDNDLIRDKALHIRIRGLKFAKLDIVLTRKQTQRRFKDIMDVALASKQRFESES